MPNSDSREVCDAFPESCHLADCGLAGDGGTPTGLRWRPVTDADPGRVAGTINGHTRGAHTDIGLSDGHASATNRYAGTADGHAGAADRYASSTDGHAGAAHGDIGSPNGHAGTAACHADAAAVAHRHA